MRRIIFEQHLNLGHRQQIKSNLAKAVKHGYCEISRLSQHLLALLPVSYVRLTI